MTVAIFSSGSPASIIRWTIVSSLSATALLFDQVCGCWLRGRCGECGIIDLLHLLFGAREDTTMSADIRCRNEMISGVIDRGEQFLRLLMHRVHDAGDLLPLFRGNAIGFRRVQRPLLQRCFEILPFRSTADDP